MSTPPKAKTVKAKRAMLATLIKDRPELETKLGELTRATILQNSLTAEMNAEIEAVKARFTSKLETHKETVSECTTAIETYVLSHRNELFGKDSKTVEIGGHELSFRANGGAVETVKGITQATALDRLIIHENEEIADLFVTWKASLAKDVIKAKWPDHQEFLTSIGLRLEHSENFTIKLSLVEGAETQLKAA